MLAFQILTFYFISCIIGGLTGYSAYQLFLTSSFDVIPPLITCVLLVFVVVFSYIPAS